MAAVATILTACYGGSDDIRPQAEQDIPVEWVCVVDDPAAEVPAPWLKVVARSDEPPCLAAKRHKAEPWRLVDSDHTVWVDANMQITSAAFAREAIDCIHDGLAVWRHPRRDCIYDEAEASLGAEAQGGKYDGYPLREQVASYRAEGHPERYGLFACGTVAWDARSPLARKVGAAWIAECERWSIQDQLSLPVVCRRLGVRPGVFPHAQVARRRMSNPWLTIHPHRP